MIFRTRSFIIVIAIWTILLQSCVISFHSGYDKSVALGQRLLCIAVAVPGELIILTSVLNVVLSSPKHLPNNRDPDGEPAAKKRLFGNDGSFSSVTPAKYNRGE